MLKNDIDFELIWKKINSKLDLAEETILNSWLNNNPLHREYFEKVEYYYTTGKTHDESLLIIAKAWEKTGSSLSVNRRRKLPDWVKIAASVAATVVIMLSVYIFVETGSETDSFVSTSIEILPGTSKARLIFDNGQTIDLTGEKSFERNIDGTIITNQGNQITYSGKTGSNNNKVRYNTLEIPRGAEYFIILSDSTKVWLNSDSKLRYPVAFIGNERTVELSGEAYFEVSENTKKPFRVSTAGQLVEVLGTEFNISSYTEQELIYTTLVKGKVKVFSVDNPELSKKLVPGYQTYYYRESGDISIRQVNVHEYIAWKNGVFSFRKKPLVDMMQTLSRWYDINIVFENQSKKNIQFTGDLQRYENFEEILSLIEKTHEVKFELNENEIIVR